MSKKLVLETTAPFQGLAELVAYDEGLFAKERIVTRAPTAAERAVAEAALDAVPMGRSALVYARVDLVLGDDGAPMVLELELTEPSVFLGHSDGAADRFADALLAHAIKARDNRT